MADEEDRGELRVKQIGEDNYSRQQVAVQANNSILEGCDAAQQQWNE